MRFAIGLSSEEDAYYSGVAASEQAISDLRDSPTALLVFGSSKYNQQKLIQGVRTIVPDVPLAGCSTAGAIVAEGSFGRDCVVVVGIQGSDLRASAVYSSALAPDSTIAGLEIGRKVNENFLGLDVGAVMLFCDVLEGDGGSFARVVGSQLDKSLIVGAAAGDDLNFLKTYQYCNDQVLSSAAVALGLSGSVKYGVGVQHGWMPVGKPFQVTKSYGKIVSTIDNHPAVSLYERYFGEHFQKGYGDNFLGSAALTYPVGVVLTDDNQFLIRSPVRTEKDGAVVFTSGIPEGAQIRLMLGSKDKTIEAAKIATQSALEMLGRGRVVGAFVFSSAANRRLFGIKASEEISAIKAVLPYGTPIVGFYSYGEFASNAVSGVKEDLVNFYNTSVVVFLLGSI